MPLKEYRELQRQRREIISENAARRMRKGPKLPPLPVPKLPKAPTVRVAYRNDGTYEGVLGDNDDVPADCYIRIENKLWE